MKIGVSSYSFSQYLSSGRLNLISIIPKAAAMGFEAIEYTSLREESQEKRIALAEQIKEEADCYNIELAAYVCDSKLYCDTVGEQQTEVERLKRELDIAKILGVKLFRYDVIYKLPRYKSFDSVLEAVVPAMRQLADYGADLGIKTMIENHGLAFQDCDRIEKTYHVVNHENFGLLIDIGNFLDADQDNVFAVSRLAHLACHVHLKDFTIHDFYAANAGGKCYKSRGCNLLCGTALGYGDAKAAQCLAILKQAGYDGYVDIEFEGTEDCIAELEKSLAFYKEL